MLEWIVFSKRFCRPAHPVFPHHFEVGKWVLAIRELNARTFYQPVGNEALFVFGYIMPRLNHDAGRNIGENLLLGIKKHGPEYINNFKGNFVVIAFYNDKLLILNDQFGVGKYFYWQAGEDFLAANHLSFIKNNRQLEISRKNVLLYFVFNYFIGGITAFKDCFYSIGATYHLLDSAIESGSYFSIEEFIAERRVVGGKKECLENAAECWRAIMKQYLDFFRGKRISQTLTAGMDSRLILAGFRANAFNPATFTFGRGDSMDVIHAKKVAKKLHLRHDHLYPDKLFFTNYAHHASEIIQRSSGLATLFRAHRLQAYKKMKDDFDVIFFGFIGSEVIRGLFPDGLTVPKIVSDYWLTGQLQIEKYYPQGWFALSEAERYEISREILGFDLMNRPDLFLFRVMIPLHFAQDIALNETLGAVAVAPYWDLDFLDFQRNTVFFTDNRRKEDFARRGHYTRRKGPYFSANLIKKLDKENSRISLGKGYSPADYAHSLYYAAVKFAFYKAFFKKRMGEPNFDYQHWFKDYLVKYINENPISFMKNAKEEWLKQIENIKGHDELSFLNVVKAINIDMITKVL